MIVDLYDAIDRMLWALVFWIAVGAAIATPLLLLAAWAVTWAVKRAWRALRGLCGASDAPDVGLDAREAPEASDGRSADPGYQEAA